MTSKNIFANKTLAEKIEKIFSKINLNKAVVKVPRLKKAKKQNVKKSINTKKQALPVFLSDAKDNQIHLPSIVDILIKSAVENVKNTEIKSKPAFLSEKSYSILKDDKDKNVGGYGTISKHYGIAPSASYIDYKSLFSYLGKFRSQSAYENFGSNNFAGGNSSDGNKFSLIETETMDKGAKFVRYFSNPGLDIYSASLSAVPFGGMSSPEWEQFKLWMQLDKVMYRLKTSTS